MAFFDFAKAFRCFRYFCAVHFAAFTIFVHFPTFGYPFFLGAAFSAPASSAFATFASFSASAFATST
jgi:hypothetical protein